MEFAHVRGRERRHDRPARSRLSRLPLRRRARGRAAHVPLLGRASTSSADALYLNYPSNPAAACAPDRRVRGGDRWAERSEAWVLHDFAYGDLVFDGREPQSFLAVDGAREVGFELFSMSKTYGMAGWRLGFARRERRARSPDRGAAEPRSSPESSCRCRKPGSRRSPARRSPSRQRRALYESAPRPRARGARGLERVARERSSSGSGCPTG